MSEEILINVTPRETRVGVVENGMLQEVHVERASRRGYVGNVYKGRVQRVMPGMQAVFVEIGLERAAFLHASDIVRPALPVAADGAELPVAGNGQVPSISELVHEGQEIVVQVVKDPIGTKGARLSTHLSIPSRYLVLLPHARTLGISARIEDEAERQRLKDVLTPLIGEDIPAVLGWATSCAPMPRGRAAESLAFDVTYLGKVWRVVQENIVKAKVGERVYEELSLPLRSLRDMLNDDIEKVRVDSRETFEKVVKFVHKFMPQPGRPDGALRGRAADLRPVRRGGRNPARAEEGGAAEVRWLPDRRPDRGDDHHRREHRWLSRYAQSGGNRLPHQPGGGTGRGAPAATAQPRRHHHHRLHRHDGRGAQAPGIAHARKGPGARPRQDHGLSRCRRWAWSR